MYIKTLINKNECEIILKIIVENLNLKISEDEIILQDICRFLVINNFNGFGSLLEKKIKNENIKISTILEIENTMIILNLIDSKSTHRVKDFNKNGIQALLKTRNSPKKLFNKKVIFNHPNMNHIDTFNDSSMNSISADHSKDNIILQNKDEIVIKKNRKRYKINKK